MTESAPGRPRPDSFRGSSLTRARGGLLSLTVLVSALPFATGCETSCSADRDQPVEPVTSGITENGFYESNSWSEGFFDFPPQKKYRFFHALGVIPKDVSTFVGFDDCDSVAEAAGNIVIIEEVTSEFIRVRNDTCETFCLRVVALASLAPPAP
jgi:hypothetical protein